MARAVLDYAAAGIEAGKPLTFLPHDCDSTRSHHPHGDRDGSFGGRAAPAGGGSLGRTSSAPKSPCLPQPRESSPPTQDQPFLLDEIGETIIPADDRALSEGRRDRVVHRNDGDRLLSSQRSSGLSRGAARNSYGLRGQVRRDIPHRGAANRTESSSMS